MHHLAEFVLKPYIRRFQCRRILEIGAQYGENTQELVQLASVHLTVIDPCLDADLCARHAHSDRVTMIPGLSLDVLPTLSQPFDCILIDGDHNWYTVYNELQTIRERDLLVHGGTIFLHDTWWPYGRRDGYYAPERIPAEFRQPYARKGIVRGQSELSDTQGVNVDFANATHEGGPRNGVLPAVEDFLRDHGHKYQFFNLKLQYGLGVLYRHRDHEADARFAAYRREVQRRLRIGAIKDSLQSALPGPYAAAQRVAALLRGGRSRE